MKNRASVEAEDVDNDLRVKFDMIISEIELESLAGSLVELTLVTQSIDLGNNLRIKILIDAIQEVGKLANGRMPERR
ncbi:hypothetical protein K3495_g4046 [Podosphaera aphanis]|nr:hypothetical protein K3495_g4046 [Podosphaera aphanis]